MQKLGNKEIDNEKGSPKYESENANKVKNESQLNVDEQQDAIKDLKEYCDIDDRKEKAVCKPCNQPFALIFIVKHIQEKYTNLL